MFIDYLVEWVKPAGNNDIRRQMVMYECLLEGEKNMNLILNFNPQTNNYAKDIRLSVPGGYPSGHAKIDIEGTRETYPMLNGVVIKRPWSLDSLAKHCILFVKF